MATQKNQAIAQDKFLLLSLNLLRRALVDSPRTEAKRLFGDLIAGHIARLGTVEMEDESMAQFGLSLDHTEYRGALNYSGFRASVQALLDNIARSLQEGKALKVFDSRGGDNTMIFGVTAVTIDNDSPNVMVLGAEPHQHSELTTLRLLYIDPAQFTG